MLIRQVAVLLLAAATAAACVGPSNSYHDYELKAANTAEVLASTVELARLGIRAAEQDRATSTYLSTLFSELERDAVAVQATFSGVQPPGERADALRDEFLDLVDTTVEVVADLRIAARRADLGQLPDIGEPLPRLAEQLRAFEEEHAS